MASGLQLGTVARASTSGLDLHAVGCMGSVHRRSSAVNSVQSSVYWQYIPQLAPPPYVEVMDAAHRDVGDFLRTRRDRISPEQAGIIACGRRRVKGLRREEVATLAGISVDYYAKMERGDLSGVSPQVVTALARALQLDEAEVDHLHALVRAADPRSTQSRSRSGRTTIQPGLQRFIDAVTEAPVWVRNRRMDYVAANSLGRALYSPLLDDSSNGDNTARFMFLNPNSHNFFPDWNQGADDIVATLRTYAGANPHDTGLTQLVGELATRSDAFRMRWAAHHVRHHRTGIKRINHPDVGYLELVYEAMELPSYPDLFMFACTAEPGSPSDDRLKLLASLAASVEVP